jgi:hypothetical protein
MPAIGRSGALTPIQIILLTSAQNFKISSHLRAPNPLLLSGEFKDPMPMRCRHRAGYTAADYPRRVGDHADFGPVSLG